jgi:rare lipoprotein A
MTLGLSSADAKDPRLHHKTSVVTGNTTSGIASWYGKAFQGRLTYSEEKFDRHAMTCASRTIPMQSEIEVTNIETGAFIRCRVNDRGPYVHGRILDMSEHSAHVLGVGDKGLLHVIIKILKRGHLLSGKSDRGLNYVK